MSTPIKPPLRTGPAGDYDEAVRLRNLRAAEWLDLDPASIWGFTFDGPVVTWRSREATPPRPVGWVSREARWEGEMTIIYTMRLDRSVVDDLRDHLGPPPEPPRTISLWNARPEDLTPGTKLYDADGNEVGEVGEVRQSIPDTSWLARTPLSAW